MARHSHLKDGIIFSSLIGEARINISTAFAYNLMGALFGGVMEYNSMYFGFAFLYLLALGFYSLAFVVFVEFEDTAGAAAGGMKRTPLSSSAKADDPVFQRRQRLNREAAAYWIPRFRGV